MIKSFSDNAWEDYEYWQSQNDRQTATSENPWVRGRPARILLKNAGKMPAHPAKNEAFGVCQTIKRIHRLIKDIDKNGYTGIGKPEPLKHDWSGWWSRRITDEHRLIYKLQDNNILIASMRYHYPKI